MAQDSNKKLEDFQALVRSGIRRANRRSVHAAVGRFRVAFHHKDCVQHPDSRVSQDGDPLSPWNVLRFLVRDMETTGAGYRDLLEEAMSELLCHIQNIRPATYSTAERRKLRDTPYIKAKMHELINELRCPICGGTPLHFAISLNLTFAVEEFLFWGADPNLGAPISQQECVELGHEQTGFRVFYPYEQGLSPIWLAVAMHDADALRLLLQSADEVQSSCTLSEYIDDSQLEFEISDQYWNASLADIAIFEPAPHPCMQLLVENGVKLSVAALAEFVHSLATDHVLTTIIESQAVSWRPDAVRTVMPLVWQMMSTVPRPPRLPTHLVTALFAIPVDCDEPAQFYFKQLLLQSALLVLCNRTQAGRMEPREVDRLNLIVSSLIRHGANPLGWSANYFTSVHDRLTQAIWHLQDPGVALDWSTEAWGVCQHVNCKDLRVPARAELIPRRLGGEMYASEFSLYCQIPLAIRMAICNGDKTDSLVQLLSKLTDLPWLSSLDDIPVYNRMLHNGPTCSHIPLTVEQQKVSLRKLTSSQVLPRLQIAVHRSIDRNWTAAGRLQYLENNMTEIAKVASLVFKRTRRVYNYNGGVRRATYEHVNFR